jgi:hypothetical protein
MTKKEFDKYFISEILPLIKQTERKYIPNFGKVKDIPLRCQEYNYTLDSFHRDGQITDRQMQNWCIPKRLI